ncbi:NAD(P)H:quinone oxidoreductase [Nocardiopsis oceani]
MSAQVARIAVVYYSSTGNIHRLAEAVADGAADAGAEVRLRRAAELAPAEVVEGQPEWRAHLDATAHIPEATHDDLLWANGYAFGTPTRFGNVASQLRQFIDTTSGLWQAGEFAGQPATGFTGSHSEHGGQESTLLSLYNTFFHWGAVVVPTGYVDYELVTAAGGNPYGVSQVEERAEADPEYVKAVLAAARWQGGRLAAFAGTLAAAHTE